MIEVTIKGNDYRIGKLNAMDSFHLSRKLAPVLPTLIPLFSAYARGDAEKAAQGDILPLALAAEPLANALSEMSKDNAEYILSTCMSVVQIKQGKIYSKVFSDGVPMFDFLEAIDLIKLSVHVIKDSLGGFIDGLGTKEAQEAPAQ